MTDNSYCPIHARDGHGKHPRCRYCRFALLALCAILVAGCGQQFTGAAYKVQAGRTTDQLFERGVTAWQVGAEFKFDARR